MGTFTDRSTTIIRRASEAAVLVFFAAQIFHCHAAAADWKLEWEKAARSARNEGRVVIYGPHNPAYRPLWKLFESAFPGIAVDFLPGKGSEHAQRIMAERRAGKYLVDIVMGGPSTYRSFPQGFLEPLRPHLLLPEVNNASAWWKEKFWFADPQSNAAILLSGEVGTRRGSYNTELLDPAEVQSWWDLLQPRFKGKIGTFDPLVAGGGGESFAFFYDSPALGTPFIRRLLAETDILVTRNLEQGADWLAHGRIIFYIGSGQPIMRAKRQGLPVDLLPHPLKEGEIMGGGSCCMALLNRAPHPRAADVFVNWLLSREGQIAWQKYSEANSLRMDIPKNDLPAWAQPQNGVRYYMLDASENQKPAAFKAMKQVVAEALKTTVR